MAKLLTSPLFLALLVLALAQLPLYRRWARLEPWPRAALGALTGATVLLWILSLPATAASLARLVEPTGPAPDALTGLRLDAVAVLGGGFLPGPVPGLDMAGTSTHARVVRGVEVFRETGARWLIVTGRGPTGAPEQGASLMAALAASLGSPEDRILLEPRAGNTREHPSEILRLPEVSPTDRIAVVTSAWHLPRAVAEFERHFPEVVGVPAEFYGHYRPTGLEAWLPDARALHHVTHILNEIVGRGWYRFTANAAAPPTAPGRGRPRRRTSRRWPPRSRSRG